MATAPLADNSMNALPGHSNWTADIISGNVEDSEPSRTNPGGPGGDPTF